jgi:DNA-binding transcriptional LysR family regulator
MFNTWRLQLLVQFDVLGTMHRVAEVMHVSTSTVSQQLALLEKETNTVLFERVGRQVQLTLSGHEFVKQIRPILGELELIGNSMNGRSSTLQGTIRIASFASGLRTIVIPAVETIRKQYPSINVKLFEMEPGQSIPSLDSQQIDIAIVAYFDKVALDTRSLELVELGDDALKILVGKENPLSARGSVNIADLADQRWALEFDSAYLSEYLRHLCKDAGFAPIIDGVFGSYAAMRESVRRNLMICALPELAIASSQGVTLLNLVPAQARHVFMLTRSSQRNMQTLQTVCAAIVDEAEHVLDVPAPPGSRH